MKQTGLHALAAEFALCPDREGTKLDTLVFAIQISNNLVTAS